VKGQLPVLSQVPEPFAPFNVVGSHAPGDNRPKRGRWTQSNFAGFCLRHQRIGTRLHLTRSRRLHIKTNEAITRGSHLADQMFSFFFCRDGHGASSKVPVYSKPAQQSRLDGDQKALAGIALRALESAYIIASCGRFDIG
jgi:hypothetical protein